MRAAAGGEGGVDDPSRERGVAAERVPGAEADDGPESALLHQRTSARAASPAAKAARKCTGVLVRAAPHVREREAGAGPSPVVRRVVGRGDVERHAGELVHGLRVMREPAVPLPRIALGHPRRQDRPALERAHHVRHVRERKRPVAEGRAGADDPGPDAADDRLIAIARGQGERGGRADAIDVRRRGTGRPRSRRRRARAPSAAGSCPRAARAAPRPPPGRTPPGHPRAPRRPAPPGCGRCRARPAGRRSSAGSAPPSSSPCRRASCPGVYGSAITCAPSSGGRPSPRVRFA